MDTYANLKTTIEKYLARSDTTVTDRLDDFIDLTESKFNAVLRHPDQLETTTLSLTAGVNTATLPADFLSAKLLTISSDTSIRLDFMAEADASRRYMAVKTGKPQAWAFFEDDKIKVFPTPDGAYDLVLRYYSTVDALSGSNTTNWLLTKFPDAYLYGCLAEGFEFLRDDARSDRYRAKFNEMVEVIRRNGHNQALGQAGMRVMASNGAPI